MKKIFDIAPRASSSDDKVTIVLDMKQGQNKKKHFDEWAKDKSPLLGMFAFSLASSPEDCLEFLQIFKSGEMIKNITLLPPINKWLKLYRSHRQLYKGLSGALRMLDSNMSEAIDFYEYLIACFNESKIMTLEEKKEVLESLTPEQLKEYNSLIREHISELENWIINMSNGDDKADTEIIDEKEEKRRTRELLQTPEFIFYLRIWIPCFLIYGVYPPYLLRKARQGNEDAIVKLLRLDKSVIDDSKIKEIFHQASVAKTRSKFNLMIDAIQKAPKVKIEIQKIKYAIAGLLSIASIALGQKLAAKEINELFDAIARDSKGKIDEDLTVTPETFEKAVQRYRTFWQVIPSMVDKK